MKINLTSNESLFKRILLLLLLTLTLLFASWRVVVVCVVAHHLGGSIAVCVVVRFLHRCLPSALRCIVMSPHLLRRGTLSLSASSPVVWVAASSCASLSIMCVIVRCLRHRPSSASHWGFCVTLSSAMQL